MIAAHRAGVALRLQADAVHHSGLAVREVEALSRLAAGVLSVWEAVEIVVIAVFTQPIAHVRQDSSVKEEVLRVAARIRWIRTEQALHGIFHWPHYMGVEVALGAPRIRIVYKAVQVLLPAV